MKLSFITSVLGMISDYSPIGDDTSHLILPIAQHTKDCCDALLFLKTYTIDRSMIRSNPVVQLARKLLPSDRASTPKLRSTLRREYSGIIVFTH